jgi:heme oxygenase
MQSSDSGPTVEMPADAFGNDPGIESCTLRTPRPIRQALRAATSEPHARLHRHAGFAAIQNGTINLPEYRALLVRLYGFHAPFEAALGIAPERSAWLEEDLAVMNVGSPMLKTIPRCTALAAFDKPGSRLGALYVVEGSTLGGRHLAKNLGMLFGAAGSAGRRFFLGRGANTDAAWEAFLARLTLSASTPAVRSDIVAAAAATFGIFEEWLRDWRALTA